MDDNMHGRAYSCDRCGALYPEYPHRMGIYIVDRAPTPETFIYAKRICPDCELDLLGYYEQGRRTKP